MAASKTAVELSRPDVLDEVRNVIVPGQQVVVSNNEDVILPQAKALHAKAIAQLGDLALLPREVGDITLSFVLAVGFISILQASHQLAQEGSALIFKYGICRMNFAFATLIPTVRPSQELANRIQNISIRVNTACYPLLGAPPELEILELFTGSETSRKYCRVTFENDFSSRPMICSEVLFIMKEYTGFEEVVVNVKVKNWDRRLEAVDSYDLALAKRVRERAYRIVIDALKKPLGSFCHGRNDEDDMVFHPR